MFYPINMLWQFLFFYVAVGASINSLCIVEPPLQLTPGFPFRAIGNAKSLCEATIIAADVEYAIPFEYSNCPQLSVFEFIVPTLPSGDALVFWQCGASIENCHKAEVTTGDALKTIPVQNGTVRCLNVLSDTIESSTLASTRSSLGLSSKTSTIDNLGSSQPTSISSVSTLCKTSITSTITTIPSPPNNSVSLNNPKLPVTTLVSHIWNSSFTLIPSRTHAISALTSTSDGYPSLPSTIEISSTALVSHLWQTSLSFSNERSSMPTASSQPVFARAVKNLPHAGVIMGAAFALNY